VNPAAIGQAALGLIAFALIVFVGLHAFLLITLAVVLAAITGLLWINARIIIRTGPWPCPVRYQMPRRWVHR
jgi:hypothetical protein